MVKPWSFAGAGCALLFALLPAASAGGAQALPLLVSAAGVSALGWALRAQPSKNMFVFFALATLLLTWISATSLWSPAQDHARALKLPALTALGLVFAAAAASPDAARRTWSLAAAAFVVLAALLAIETFAGLPLNRAANPDADLASWSANSTRGSVVLLGLAWAAAAGFLALGRGRLGALALLVAGALTLQFAMLAAFAAFALGLAAFAFGFIAPRAAILAPALGWAFWMLAAPLLTPLIVGQRALVDALPLSWAHRVEIWRHVCARIAEAPWIGHGLDASRLGAERAMVIERTLVRGVEMDALPVHPHSASLQVWYELGAVGAVLAAALIGYGGWRLAGALQHNRPAAAAAAATLASLGLIANVSFAIWQEWWIAAMFIAAAVVGAVAHLSRERQASG